MRKLYTTEKLNAIAPGDDAFIKMMLSTFVSSCQEAIHKINSALEQADFDTIGRTGHKIKPSVDTVAPHLSKDVRKIEGISGSRNLDELNQFLFKLDATVTELRTDLSHN